MSKKKKPRVIWSSNDQPKEAPKDRRFIRKGPCAECPFKKDCEPGTGNDNPLVYVGQAAGPFWLPCHMDQEYNTNRLSHTLTQCGGAATFRANVGISEKFPESHFLKLPPDDGDKAFKSYTELVAHHAQISIAEAEAILKTYPPEALVKWQLLVAHSKGRDPKPIKEG